MDEIYVLPYDPNWVKRFEQEEENLRNIFIGENPLIEHVGSTSVIGLDAKPVIDVMIGFSALSADEIVKKMESAGYSHWYEDTFRTTRLFFTRWNNPERGKRLVNVHVTTIGNSFWNDQIRFRDMLRGNPKLAHEYADLKKELAIKFKNDREGYTEAKTEFVKKALSS